MSRRPIQTLTSREKSGEGQQSTHTTTRIVCGAFLADIIVDSRTDPPIWHCVVQREGSPEVLYWAQEATFEQARSAAEDHLKELTSRARHKKARAGR